jgi:transposase
VGTMERYSKVGMQELDQRLSKIVEAARIKPVSVYRYGAPWVWIVSQEDWQNAVKEVTSFIPPKHSLVLLRPEIEALLRDHQAMLDDFQDHHALSIAPATLIHILLLQVLYSVPSDRQLYEQLGYNLLFRWFVGLDLKQKVWSFSELNRGVDTLLNEPQAVKLVQYIVTELFCGALMQMPEFTLNFALLHTWLAKHAGAPITTRCLG